MQVIKIGALGLLLCVLALVVFALCAPIAFGVYVMVLGSLLDSLHGFDYAMLWIGIVYVSTLPFYTATLLIGDENTRPKNDSHVTHVRESAI